MIGSRNSVINNWKELDRKERYKIVLELTNDSSLAYKARDWTRLSTVSKRLDTYFTDYTIIDKKAGTEKTVLIVKGLAIKKEVERKVPIGETTRERYKRQRAIARRYGYTSSEADKIKTKKSKDFFDIIEDGKIIDLDSRVEKWSKWSKSGRFPSWIIENAQRINEINKIDINSSYGWNAVYMYYTEAGSLQFWEDAYAYDPLDSNRYQLIGSE